MDEPLRCTHCGDIIGVYEALVAISDGRAYETSPAAGAPGAGHRTDCFHRACYEAHRHARTLDEYASAEAQ
jgi:hypothetical protein